MAKEKASFSVANGRPAKEGAGTREGHGPGFPSGMSGERASFARKGRPKTGDKGEHSMKGASANSPMPDTRKDSGRTKPKVPRARG